MRNCVVCSSRFKEHGDAWWCSDPCWERIVEMRKKNEREEKELREANPTALDDLGSEAAVARKAMEKLSEDSGYAVEGSEPASTALELVDACCLAASAAKALSGPRDALPALLLAREYLDQAIRTFEEHLGTEGE